VRLRVQDLLNRRDQAGISPAARLPAADRPLIYQPPQSLAGIARPPGQDGAGADPQLSRLGLLPPTQTSGLPAGYLPLFPFASLAEVRAWQASYASGGHQPWHRSPDVTATAFAASLGYRDVTEVAGSSVSRGDAHVAVGIKLPNGTIGTAAVIHLVLFGSGRYAPWTVVGTTDTTFTPDHPGTAARCARR
jgi:hypothetical protein